MDIVKNLLWAIGVVVIIGLLWFGFSQQEVEAPSEATPGITPVLPRVTVGWLGPLSGESVQLGQHFKRGVELAVRDLPTAAIEVVFEDSRCEEAAAVSALQKMITTHGVIAVVGGVCAEPVRAAAPVAQRGHVVMISAAPQADISPFGDYVFSIVPSDSVQAAFAARLVVSDGHARLAIVYSDDDYGRAFNDIFAEEFSGEIVAAEALSSRQNLRNLMVNIRTANPEAVYIATRSVTEAAAVLREIQQLRIETAVYGPDALRHEDLLVLAADAADGLVLTVQSLGSSHFAAKYREVYGEEPGPLAAQGYDAFVSLQRALERARTQGSDLYRALDAVEFDGASGPIRFEENGLASGHYDVLTIEGGAFVRRSLAR